jgi:transposase-like protein
MSVGSVLENVYGFNTSPQYVSNINKTYLEVRKRWQERRLDRKYIACTLMQPHMNIRRSTVKMKPSTLCLE